MLESPHKSLAFLTVEPSLEATMEDRGEIDNTAYFSCLMMNIQVVQTGVPECTPVPGVDLIDNFMFSNKEVT